MMENSSSFFCNKECKYFPCHETKDPDSFNCLFCYCPLYSYGEMCGGHFKYSKRGIKSCIDCSIPHHPNSAEYINAKLKEFNAAKTDERSQLMVCLDLEGVLFPEIWEAVAEEKGVPELKRTTRDDPSYDRLMSSRMELCKEHGIKLQDILAVIERMEPLPGALEFLKKLQSIASVAIISDTFEQFAKPVEKKLGIGIYCNTLQVDEEGNITGYSMRCRDTKTTTVKGFKAMGYFVIASGDSYNDIGMIGAADKGFFIHPPAAVKDEFPAVETVGSLDELYEKILQEKNG